MKLLLLLSFAALLAAHDLYLMPQKFRTTPGEKILLSVHTGDSFPASEHAVDPARLRAWPALPETSWRMLGKATHTTLTTAAQGQMLAVATAPRLLEMAPEKFLAYLLEEGLESVALDRKAKGETALPGRERYSKYAKTYVHSGPGTSGYDQPLGLRIEFVPQADPATLRPGQNFPILLLSEGKPLANAQVLLAISADAKAKTDYTVAGRTDAQGRLSIKLPSAGKMRLHAIEMRRIAAPTHDWESFWASFTFEVAPDTRGASSVVSSR